MRRAALRGTRTQVARRVSVSAPVGGWNARDPIAEMKDSDAITLDNMFCTPYDVRVRQGSIDWATGISGNVNTLATYSPIDGSIKLFAAAGANIFDVTTQGVVGSAVVSGQTSDKWQHVNFGTAGGNFLCMANGADLPQTFNGSTWTNPAITGPSDNKNLISPYATKSRLWYIEKNSLKVWYLPVLSIAGAATSIDFTGLVNLGGYLMAMCDWSLDAGYGMDDYVAFITSEGQVLIYKGTDPSSVTTWSLVGVYNIGAPVGRRCMMKYAGDVIVVCQDGLAPLSKALMSSRVNSQEMLTDKIQHVISDYVTSWGSNFGWETTLFPKENMLLMNVPTGTGSYQLVMNTISGAWSRFLDWNANTFELHGDQLYFGGNGKVCKAYYGLNDSGSNINFEAQQSFTYMGNDSQQKMVKMLRPMIASDGNPSVYLGVNVDFDTAAPTGIPTFSPSTSATWGSSVWGEGLWGGQVQIKKDWQTAFAIGYCISAHMLGSISDLRFQWAATDYLVENGGAL